MCCAASPIIRPPGSTSCYPGTGSNPKSPPLPPDNPPSRPWPDGYADPRLTAQAPSPMDKPRKTPCTSPTLPTGRRLPTSFTALQQQQRINSIPEKRNHQPATSFSLFSAEAVQTTGTVALLVFGRR